MRDRISSELAPIAGRPGEYALRYGIYDANGALLRYEYIRAEDEPIEEGTALNKGNLLSDTTTSSIFPLFADYTVDNSLYALSLQKGNRTTMLEKLLMRRF